MRLSEIAPRIERIDGADQIVVEADRILSGISLISNAGARFETPETISAQGRFEDVQRRGYDPEQHLEDMARDGVAGEVLYPSQGLFYFKMADTQLISAIFRACNADRRARRAALFTEAAGFWSWRVCKRYRIELQRSSHATMIEYGDPHRAADR
jgi:hypothetical protein